MITLKRAKEALEASERKAKELGIAVTTVVVDEHGSIVAVERMDGAIPISPRFAYAKAFTSANLGMPTDAIEQYAAENKPYFSVNTLFGGELTTIAGGLPVTMDGKIVGGVGVGGSTDTKQDLDCAKESVKILTS